MSVTKKRHPASSSPDAYIAWLEAMSDAEAKETAEQFTALSAGEQDRFLSLINDPETTKAFMAPAAEAVTTLADGDVVIKREGDTAPSLQSGSDMWASYSVYDTIFGIKVTRVTVRTNYHVTGTNTDKVYPGSATHKNFVPATSFSHGAVDEWISAEPADNAHTETTWRGEFTGIASWEARERVWADYRGFVGGYLKHD